MPKRLSFVSAVLVFRGTLDICYVYYLADAFEFDSITPFPVVFSAGRYALSYAAVIAVSLFLPFGKQNLSGIFFLAAMAFLFVPMTSVVGLNQNKLLYSMVLAGGAVLMSALVLVSRSQHAIVERKPPVVAVVISVAFVIFFIAWSIASGALGEASISLADIYLYRDSASDLLDPGLLAYINLWTQKVFNPFLLALALFYRKRFFVLACVVLQVYFFAVTQHRTHIFVPALVYFVYLLYTRPISITHLYLLMSAALLVVLSASLYWDLEPAPSIVIRRAFFVAASATDDWIHYFTDSPHVYFADNLLKSFIHNEYTGENLPALMSELVFGGKPFGFNVGIVGAGYAQLGVLGVLLYAGALGLIVRLINRKIGDGLPVFIAAAIMFDPLRTAWADSDLFTTILSHGLAVGTALLWVYGSHFPRLRRTAVMERATR